MKNRKALIIKTIQKHLTKSPDISYKKITDKIFASGKDYGYSRGTIAQTFCREAYQAMNKPKSITLKTNTNTHPSKKDTCKAIKEYTTNDVYKVIAAYTKDNANLTWTQVQNLGIVNSKVLSEIKTTFGITKDFNAYASVVSPDVELHEVPNIIEKEVAWVLEKYSTEFSPSITSAMRELKKQIYDAGTLKRDITEITKVLAKKLEDIDMESLLTGTNPIDVVSTDSELAVVLTDLHIGMISDKYNMSVAKDKLIEIISSLSTEKDIHIVLLGDILHTVSGLNHPNSWQDVDMPKGYGATVIIEAYKMLAGAISIHNNVKSINIVGG